MCLFSHAMFCRLFMQKLFLFFIVSVYTFPCLFAFCSPTPCITLRPQVGVSVLRLDLWMRRCRSRDGCAARFMTYRSERSRMALPSVALVQHLFVDILDGADNQRTAGGLNEDVRGNPVRSLWQDKWLLLVAALHWNGSDGCVIALAAPGYHNCSSGLAVFRDASVCTTPFVGKKVL